MSTRCQVKVTQSGLGWNQSVMLYHHCDGYPENMVPLFHKAYAEGMKPTDYGTWKAENKWKMGLAGKVAAMLCYVDPRGFEPEAGFDIHGDIEFLYEIEVVNSQGGSMAEVPKWIIRYQEDGQSKELTISA
jgi:hypothetical protein